MPWGRLDDTLYDHPKLDALGSAKLQGVGLWTLAITWSNRWLTDGAIPTERIKKLGGSVALANRLVDAGLFDKTATGYQIHDFLEFNDSREEILAKRAQERDKKRRQRANGSAHVDRDPNDGRFTPLSPQVSPGDTPRDNPRDSLQPSPATRPVPSRRSESRTPSAVPAREAGGSSEPRLTKAQLDAWATFVDPCWEPFKRAWLARGLRLPPFGDPDDDPDTSQRSRLYRIATDRPNDLARWVTEAPSNRPREIIAHIFDRWGEVAEQARRDQVAPIRRTGFEAVTAVMPRAVRGQAT